MKPSLEPIVPARIRFDQDTPYAPDFADHYFMAGQGQAESEQVFLAANRLPERFAALASGELMVVGETGFGTGLNLLLAARCFQRHAPPGSRLHWISAELYPLDHADLAKALSAWPELSDLAAALLNGYPPAAAGSHRLSLTSAIQVDMVWADATWAWQHSQAQVDAWCLDGFAPARNPAMWRPELFQALAKRSRPGATLGSFTAAGEVRRGLADAGFTVQRKPGFAGKRHRTEAQWPGQWQPQRWQRGRALIAGAGLAGATTARALAERGWQVQVVDPAGVASAASGNHAGVVYSSPSPHLTPQNRFYQASLIHALGWLKRLVFPARPEHGRLNEVIFQPVDDRAHDKLAAAAETGAWPEALLKPIGSGRFSLVGAGFLSPPAWCRHLLDHPAIERHRDRLTGFAAATDGQPVTARLENGGERSTDLLVLCNAQAAAGLPALDWLPLKIIRGQVSHVRARPGSQALVNAICHSGYFTPALEGLHCVGASFDLRDPRPVIKPADDIDNIDQLRRNLPEVWQALGGEALEVVSQRAALRCQSRDFLPLAGPLPDAHQIPHTLHSGVMLNIAHGSRGITHTPLCASLVADLASGLPPAADSELMAALAPERFIIRERRKRPRWPGA